MGPHLKTQMSTGEQCIPPSLTEQLPEPVGTCAGCCLGNGSGHAASCAQTLQQATLGLQIPSVELALGCTLSLNPHTSLGDDKARVVWGGVQERSKEEWVFHNLSPPH